MLYQKILTSERPYIMTVGRLSGFDEHRHADLEFNFCLDGGFDIVIEKERYRVGAGEMTFIGPMASHEIPHSDESRKVMTVVVGSSFLKKNFSHFSAARAAARILRLDGGTHAEGEIRRLFFECESLLESESASSEMLLTGNLYKICAYILDMLSDLSEDDDRTGELSMVESIERALEMIYYDYKKTITVDDAAAATGYGKSNFCKIFKSVVGEGFHKALNRQRVRCAAGLLAHTSMSVADVAEEVGFCEAKTFCRVFGTVMGMTPGEYRRSKQK